MTNEQKYRLIRELRIRKARTCLFTFYKLVYPQFKHGWFQRELCEEFQRFYEDLKAGLQPRLMVFAPPRHGKSTAVHALSAWVYGDDPDFQQIGASYGATLAKKNNNFVQKVMDTDIYKEIFPGTSLPTRSSSQLKNNDEFEIAGHSGSYRAASVGGSVTGTGADLGIIDDPVKGMKDASSKSVQATQRDWFTGDFYTRLSPESGIIIFLTRWSKEDLAGYLLKEQDKGAEKWRVLSFPAIAEHNEYKHVNIKNGSVEYSSDSFIDGYESVLLRKEGEPLHSERWNLERLGKIRKVAEARGVWQALFQQRPVPKGGGIFKKDWFPRYERLSDLYSPNKSNNEIIATAIHADTAQKVKQVNDYSVFEVWGIGKQDIYLVDLFRGKWESWELELKAKEIIAKWRHVHKKTPPCRGMYIEDKASGIGLIQNLKKDTKFPIIGVPRNTDKVERAKNVSPNVKAGNVWIPERAPWLNGFISEVNDFTETMSHSHDDQVDPMIDAIETWLDKPASIYDLFDD